MKFKKKMKMKNNIKFIEQNIFMNVYSEVVNLILSFRFSLQENLNTDRNIKYHLYKRKFFLPGCTIINSGFFQHQPVSPITVPSRSSHNLNSQSFF